MLISKNQRCYQSSFLKENDFIKKINKDNPEIYKTVKESLREVFDKNFSEMEIAFISLHFVATLERSDLVLPLSAVLVSSRGRISCEFIMSNLRKNFPFLKDRTYSKFNPYHSGKI